MTRDRYRVTYKDVVVKDVCTQCKSFNKNATDSYRCHCGSCPDILMKDVGDRKYVMDNFERLKVKNPPQPDLVKEWHDNAIAEMVKYEDERILKSLREFMDG